MLLPLKKTQTLIGSIISTISLLLLSSLQYTRRKYESQGISIKYHVVSSMGLHLLFFILLTTCYLILATSSAYAITDPTSTTNNKFGIHIISPTNDEVNAAVDLVNTTGGDWGYIILIIEDRDMKVDKFIISGGGSISNGII